MPPIRTLREAITKKGARDIPPLPLHHDSLPSGPPFSCQNSNCKDLTFQSQKGLKAHVMANRPCFLAYLKVLKASKSNHAVEDVELAFQTMDLDQGPLEWADGDWEDGEWEDCFKRNPNPAIRKLAPAASSHGRVVADSEIRIQFHQEGGKSYGQGPDLYQSFEDDINAGEREKNPYYPFHDDQDYRLATWLSRLNIPMKEVDKFLKLSFVKTHPKPPSFLSARDLRKKIESLPPTPKWHSVVVDVPGGKTKSKEERRLYFRFAKECFIHLFKNPMFDGNMELRPYKKYLKSTGERLVDEPMSANYYNDIQDLLNEGETIGIIIIGSDKTHLTNHQGDKECHNVFITCGNIKKDIRNKASARCWMHVAQIPVVTWEDKDLQGILSHRMFHQCHDIIFGGAKKCSFEAERMVAADGKFYNVRMILGGDISDHPEQCMIAVRKESASPLSEAGPTELGDDFMHPSRTRDKILSDITACQEETKTKVSKPEDPDSPTYLEDMKTYLLRYKKVALENYGLNAVEKPFWQDWFQADPSTFLVPDPLHQWFKCFKDHPFLWSGVLLGKEEIDKRLSVLQPMVGYRHFTRGITRFQQHTCREIRDLLRYFIAILPGHENITSERMKMFRAFVDFVYIGQYQSHSPETLGYLTTALQDFHDHKESVAYLRDGPKQKCQFNIPKLEKMHHVPRLIPLMGTAPQFSTEFIESCHRMESKIPYQQTNKKEYAGQMCCHSDRKYKLYQYDDYLLYRSSDGSISIEDSDDLRGEDEAYGDDLTEVGGSRAVDMDNAVDQAGMLRKVRVRNLFAKNMPRPIMDGFSRCDQEENELLISNETTVFKLTTRLRFLNAPVGEIAGIYNLPDLKGAIGDFIRDETGGPDRRERRISENNCHLPFQYVDVWDHVGMQLRSSQDEMVVLPFQTVQALPPDLSKGMPYGRCNFALVKDKENQSYIGMAQGHTVVQIRLIFKPVIGNQRTSGPPLAYVQYFSPLPGTIDKDERFHAPSGDYKMFEVVRAFRANKERKGDIIKLTDIWRPVQLVPKFGLRCPPEWTCNTAVEEAKSFLVNCFVDKETYQSVY